MGFTPPTMAVRHRDADRKALPRHAREHNRSLIVRTLYQSGPQSRADLSRATGLAKVTVSELVLELVEAGFVRELGTRAAKGPGKPAVIVDLAWDAFLIAAVDLSEHDLVRGALMTMDTTLVDEILVYREGATGQEAIDILLSVVANLLEKADRPVLGIGIGTPGIVGPSGIVQYAPNLGWADVPLQSLIGDTFEVPTVVMNDANLAALGEQLYGEGASDFLLVKVGQGIGAGLILGGALVSGARQTVGEIGHLVVAADDEPLTEYSPEQILERWIAVPDLRARLRSENADEETVLREAGSRLGSALAPIVAMLDLNEVVLYGPEDLLDGPLSDEAMRVVEARTLPQTHQNLQIRLSAEGSRLVLLGCAAQVLSAFLGVVRGAAPNGKQ